MSGAGNDQPIALQGSVWLSVGGATFGGAGRVALLAALAECGSITQAAKAVKMSYKAAWDAVDAMNNLAGEPLVERLSGGKGGGGTRLTPRGAQLVANFNLIEEEHRRFVAQLARQAGGMADDLLMIRRMGLNTSARNQFLGRVVRLARGAVNDEVELEVAGAQRIVATVTRASLESLGLAVGAEAYALVKASSIVLATQAEGVKFSASNRLAGHIVRLQPGAVNTEVVLALAGGATLAAIVTSASGAALRLDVGAPATAIFNASSVILGVPA